MSILDLLFIVAVFGTGVFASFFADVMAGFVASPESTDGSPLKRSILIASAITLLYVDIRHIGILKYIIAYILDVMRALHGIKLW